MYVPLKKKHMYIQNAYMFLNNSNFVIVVKASIDILMKFGTHLLIIF